MRIGCVLRNSGPEARDAVRRIPEVVADLGLDAVWASDHVLAPPEIAVPYGAQWLDPFVSLAIAHERAPVLGLGISVLVVPYRRPIPTMKALTSLQALSGGRLVCGVGSGWSHEEFTALGLDFAGRGHVTDHYLQQMRHAAVRKDFVPADPVPLLSGGNGAVALRRAAELGGWHPIARTPAQVADGLAALPDGTRCALRTRLGLGRDRKDRPLFGTPDEVSADVAAYAAAGVTDLVVDYAVSELDEVEAQLRRFAKEVAWQT